MDTLPPFPGFRPHALAFLRDLRANNEREWFKPRKATFDDELMWPARCLVADVSGEAARTGLPLTADASKGVFRIYRDTRFSRNKAPYKTHVGMVWSRGGRKDEDGALYVHVAPGECFVAAGFWEPEPARLRRWREQIAADPSRLCAAIADVEAAEVDGAHPAVSGRAPLTRMPRGFESFAGSDAADLLRWKGVVATLPVPEEAVREPAFARTVVAFGHAVRPLLDWGWDAAAPPDA